MSERIVNDPSQHGWIEVDGKWVWDASGGGAGAGMVISETEPTDKVEGMQWLNPTTGLVLFWDDEKWLQMPTTGAAGKDGVDGVDGLWTDNGDTSISYNAGNVGIGTDTPLRKLHISEDSGSAFLQVTTKDDSSSGGVLMGSSSNPTVGQVFYDHYSDSMRLVTSNEERMIIDADGKVSFKQISIDSGSIWRNVSGTGGIAFSSDSGAEITPLGNDGLQTDAQMNFGRRAYRFKNGYFSGTVTLRSGVAVGSRDIIETLSTLRASTLDETVDVRQALASACDKLIEKFEAMQSTATQEISDE